MGLRQGAEPARKQMRIATAGDGRRFRGSPFTGNAASAARLTGGNLRGPSQLKLERVAQFMKEQRPLVTCLMVTWRVTPQGLEMEEMGGFLVSPQKRTGVFSFGHYLASRALPWAGHEARMSKNRLSKRPMLS